MDNLKKKKSNLKVLDWSLQWSSSNIDQKTLSMKHQIEHLMCRTAKCLLRCQMLHGARRISREFSGLVTSPICSNFMLRMPSVIIFFYCGFSNYEYRQHIFLPDLTAFSYKDNVLFSLNFNVIWLVCFSLFALNIKHSIKTMNGLVVNFFREKK